jgi:alkylated DNA repair dioxygenase AlkB
MAVIQPSLFPFSPSSTLPPGFRYCPYVITPDDECRLLNRIADLPFKEFQFHGFEGKRRVVSFGWRYDFSEHKALPADPIPDFVLELHRKVQAASGFALPDLAQVLVTEYAPGAPIGWHKDRPFFDDVMGLSLASACNFRLRKSLDEGKWRRVSLRLEPAPSVCRAALPPSRQYKVYRCREETAAPQVPQIRADRAQASSNSVILPFIACSFGFATPRSHASIRPIHRV